MSDRSAMHCDTHGIYRCPVCDELAEQARLLGMSASREAKLLALNAKLAEIIERLVPENGRMHRIIEEQQARIAELERIGEHRQDILEIQESRIHEACEVYAGMEGFVPETAPEAYCLRIIDQMNKALLGVGDE